MKLVLLIILGGLMHAVGEFSSDATAHDMAAGAVALAAGFLILAGFFSGKVFARIGLPQLTGYLAAGIVVGPHVLELLPQTALDELDIFNGVAIALIALTAGVEMHFESLKPLIRSIKWITLVSVVGTAVILSIATYILHDMLPFMHGMTMLQQIAVSCLLGVTLSALSPAVAVALRDETQADGPMTRTILAVVVLADLVIILLFALASTFAQAVLPVAENAPESNLLWEIVGSGVVGVVIGFLMSIYLRFVKGGGALFVVAVTFVMAEVGRRMHFDPLLVALAAGIFIRNATTVSERLHNDIESASFPVYIAFFAVTGAGVHLDVLAAMGLPAIIFVVVRGISYWSTNNLAARIADAPREVRVFGGFGLIPQAGLALALAILFQRNFPHLGTEAAALILGVVALNEMIAPIFFRIALIKSGEAGQLGKLSQPSEAEVDLPPDEGAAITPA